MKITFEPFALDSESRQLLREGAAIHLSPKAFDLLHFLVAQRPRAVPKAELQNHLWPDTFVSEVNLPGLVTEIRHALNDRSREPRFIRTVHGFGYAFCAAACEPAVEPVTGAPGSVSYWITWPTGQAALVEGENVVGRGRGVAVWIDDASVSRRHARVLIGDRKAILEDGGSKNGTYLRGQRINSAVELADDDEITIGAVSLRFRIAYESESTRTQTNRSSTSRPEPADT